jgi:AP-1 complex subunit gamma-1
MHVAVWCIGEYGDHLLLNCGISSHGSEDVYDAIPVAEILGLLEAVLKSHLATVLTKSYVLTALVKLSNRLEEGQIESLSLIKLLSVTLCCCLVSD